MHSFDTIHVDLGERAYDIFIGPGLLSRLGERCAETFSARKTLLVTDENVAGHHLAAAENSLRSAGFAVTVCVLPPGEESKSTARLASLWEAAVKAKLDRKSFFVALGGGVIGDLAGFAAASYLRGVPFVQVPTSLLAMVDSAVGGKTGINLPQGKNLVGAFHQPALVLADLQVLNTLPAREFSAGMAEVIKYGIIWDRKMFEAIEDHVDAIRALHPDLLKQLVRRSCEIKAEMVRKDEREHGMRALLNYGHTLGHAIENVSGYGEHLHGEAIAIGMVYASKLSERLCGLPAAATHRQIELFKAFDLPVSWQGMKWGPLFEAMTVDKKAENALPRFVLADSLGQANLPRDVEVACLKTVFEEESP
ncbi:MAG: 3-dehydroquinate synthase [Verrucomicrobia bacterium]|nr:3-dehydroquinate synthase [Verrucomicrobiota bacterium]MCH8511241.1 3-dehydroquinate synthase [Kiritimatiellia bacterium]